MLAPLSLAATPNRAVVCLYLLGGNDSNNMVVPLDSPAYDSYARARQSLALSADSLLPVADGAGGRYGFHPSLPGLRDLYNQNAVAVVANVGRVAPDRHLAGDASDFTGEMQLRCLPDGYLTVPWAVPGALDASIQKSMPLAHGVSLATTESSPQHRRELTGAISAGTASESLPSTALGQKLGTVLSSLKASAFRRQTFVVPMGGFGINRNQAAVFAELDEALVAFHRAVSEIGMAQSVTVYTDTEFNRSLAPNKSGGTDHAWGGHQFVLGGSVLGGRIYGTFPSMQLGAADDAVGNGTWRPSISNARYAATLARWYGRTDLSGVPEYAGSYEPSEPLLDFIGG
jgi:uncharacterized protein (DUF1501 family)